MISFRMNWFDLLAAQGTLKSILQHHSFESIRNLLELINEFSKVAGYNGEGDGTPLQYSCLENPMDGGAW